MHVIGTAGHVDHGKSALVQALTGMDPDRLAEEKARAMTIDLGFAWLMLDGEEVGIVDVPGHRDFIENMLAGVGGIDCALFVIAADEGIMPQTREHLAILDLLEVKRGVVALTKTDLIDDPEWLELVTMEVADALGGTALAGAPIVPVSARTRDGLPALLGALSNALRQIGDPPDLGRPRLAIDRIFSLAGFGTVVTGTLLDGRLRVGDEVEVQPGDLVARIRGLQTHKTKRETAVPGSRVAINLTGVARDELRRGQVVAARGFVRATTLIDVLYRHLGDADAPLEHNQEVKLFVGADEVTAHARVIGRERVLPGEESWLQLALAGPAAVVRGDRFILRRPSPGATLGGGRVLDPRPGRRHRRFRAETTERFRTLAQGTPEELLLKALAQFGPLAAPDLMERAGLAAEEGQLALASLLADGQARAVGKSLVTAAWWAALRERALSILTRYHVESPRRLGIDREEWRSRLHASPPLFNALREELLADSAIIDDGALIRLNGHTVRFSPEEQRAIARLEDLLEQQGVNSPSIKECKALVGEPIYDALVDLGRLQPLTEDVVYSAAEYRALLARLETYLREHGAITAAEARDLLGSSRKYAIALLEHLDELRITRRAGDTRELVRPLPART